MPLRARAKRLVEQYQSEVKSYSNTKHDRPILIGDKPFSIIFR
jgi:hypothetical protein